MVLAGQMTGEARTPGPSLAVTPNNLPFQGRLHKGFIWGTLKRYCIWGPGVDRSNSMAFTAIG